MTETNIVDLARDVNHGHNDRFEHLRKVSHALRGFGPNVRDATLLHNILNTTTYTANDLTAMGIDPATVRLVVQTTRPMGTNPVEWAHQVTSLGQYDQPTDFVTTHSLSILESATDHRIPNAVIVELAMNADAADTLGLTAPDAYAISRARYVLVECTGSKIANQVFGWLDAPELISDLTNHYRRVAASMI